MFLRVDCMYLGTSQSLFNCTDGDVNGSFGTVLYLFQPVASGRKSETCYKSLCTTTEVWFDLVDW